MKNKPLLQTTRTHYVSICVSGIKQHLIHDCWKLFKNKNKIYSQLPLILYRLCAHDSAVYAYKISFLLWILSLYFFGTMFLWAFYTPNKYSIKLSWVLYSNTKLVFTNENSGVQGKLAEHHYTISLLTLL